MAADTLGYLYNLVVETETVVFDSCFSESENVGEVLVHRFYVEAHDSTDKLVAVYGNDVDPLAITAPGGVWKSFWSGGSWNSWYLSPIILEVDPCAEFNSYATIGLDAASEGDGESASLVEDYQLSPTVSEFFGQNTLGEPVELNVNTLTGASWYVLNSASNSLPDEDGRWLVMQLTSAAHVEGVLNFQIFPLGEGADQIQITRPFNSQQACGYPDACNYEPGASDNQDLCDYSCCPGPGCCGEGTTWDIESQTCVTTYLHDADFDGCVGLSDLLSLLSVFGSCLEE